MTVSERVRSNSGLSFALTEEQRLLQASVRDFAAREIAPNIDRWEDNAEFPEGLLCGAGELDSPACRRPSSSAVQVSITSRRRSSRKNAATHIVRAAASSSCTTWS